jgi:cytosine/adenosine deaminase-related metal-dependent hydrolase
MSKFEAAIEMVEKHDGDFSGLLKMAFAPGQADTSTEELLLKTQDWARRLDVPVTLHFAQSSYEIENMATRVSMTPVAWIHNVGFLQENVILGHAFYLGNSVLAGKRIEDVEIIANSGASISHSPWIFGRDGEMMVSFYKYQQAGINMSLGTDTCPQNIIHSMRYASIFSKAVEGNPNATTGEDVFNAATLGGARALGRDDLGKLCNGAKADIVIFSGSSMNMVPLRDPINNIVFSAEAEDVETVIIDGKIVKEDDKVLGVAGREEELFLEIQKIGEHVWSGIESVDRMGRTVDQLSPLSLRNWE